MQIVSQNQQGSQRSVTLNALRDRRSVRRSPCTTQCHATSHVLTLGQSNILSLPSLAGVPADYTFSQDSTGLVRVAQHLIRLNVASEVMWRESNNNLITFVQAAFDSLLDNAGGVQCSEHMEIGLTVSNKPVERWELQTDTVMAVAIDIGNCGFLCLGKAVNALEDEAVGLGAAFYSVLVSSLAQYCHIFDYSTAEYSRDCQVEMACDELGVDPDNLPEEAKANYEFYEPKRAVPSRILAAVQSPIRFGAKQPLALLSSHRSGIHAAWIELVIALDGLAKRYKKAKGDQLEDSCLPSFLLAFNKHDDIIAAFDDYSQTALEGDTSTVYVKRFDAAIPAEIKAALTSVTLITQLYSTTCKLAESINLESDPNEN
jgi:hypothetical protein